MGLELEFVKKGKNAQRLDDAVDQQEQLDYFLTSEIQNPRVIVEQAKQWFERDYVVNDNFVEYIKSVFKPDVALKFFKYLRKPVVASKIIHNRIIPQLKRVFHAEDSSVDYSVFDIDENEYLPKLTSIKHKRKILKDYIFHHNDIYITDLDGSAINMPVQYRLNIKHVVSIDTDEETIYKIAFHYDLKTAEGDVVKGKLYIDDINYIFFDSNDIQIASANHDLGYCPARWIAPAFDDYGVIRRSIFTNSLPEFEQYLTLKTIQAMIEPNGAIPVLFMLDFKTSNNTPLDNKGPDSEKPIFDNTQGGQVSEYARTNAMKGDEGFLNPGQRYEIPVRINPNDGKIDSDVVQKMFKWEFIPIEALEYLDKRINDIETAIVRDIVGDSMGGETEGAKNEMQVEKSMTVLQNTLTSLSEVLSEVKSNIDFDYLNLKYPNKVENAYYNFGTDFFLEDEKSLLEKFKVAPNPIERGNLLMRLTENKYKTNQPKKLRNKILYHLLPYNYDLDFQAALERGILTNEQFKLQTKFSFYISMFEAVHGDIVAFYNGFETETPNEKYILINNLLNEIIKQDETLVPITSSEGE